jgi:hypothetical protein
MEKEAQPPGQAFPVRAWERELNRIGILSDRALSISKIIEAVIPRAPFRELHSGNCPTVKRMFNLMTFAALTPSLDG